MGPPETRCAAYSEDHVSAICGKVGVATKLSEWPLRTEHCRPLFVRKFNATIDENEELMRSLGPSHVGERIKIWDAF